LVQQRHHVGTSPTFSCCLSVVTIQLATTNIAIATVPDYEATNRSGKYDANKFCIEMAVNRYERRTKRIELDLFRTGTATEPTQVEFLSAAA